MIKDFEKFEEGDFAKLNLQSLGLTKYGIVKKGELYEVSLDDSKKIDYYSGIFSKVEKKKISKSRFIHNFKSKYNKLTEKTKKINSLNDIFLLNDFYKFNKKLELLMEEDYSENLNKIHNKVKIPFSNYFVAKKNSYLEDTEYVGIITNTTCFSGLTIENILKDNKIIDVDYGVVNKIPLVGNSERIIKIVEQSNPYYLDLSLRK